MFDEEFNGCRWGFTYLRTDSRLTLEDKLTLMYEATLLYLNEKGKKKITGATWEGTLYRTGKYETLGAFSGQRFNAELDTEHGKTRLEFLVTEPINAANN